ncbi:MAG: PTS fructose transporter subunit IIA [Desulfobacteraceae bacterium]|nr:PTS fructose transporter subunit IIA [Desulfobacteraceae bacterium]
MTGILTVTHGNFGKILAETVEFILDKKIENVLSVSVIANEDPEALRKKIKQGINKVKTDKGVIVFTDMFGGTPSNLSYSFLEEGKIEVISGLNLPLLLKAVTIRDKSESMEKMIATLIEHGKKSISLASGILNGKKRN